jgi:hypothetical protein
MQGSYVIGSVLAAVLFGPCLLSCPSSGQSSESQANCSGRIVTAPSRDADAQVLVDQVDPAIVTAHVVRDDVPLSAILILPQTNQPIYMFTAKDRPVVTVGFDADGKATAGRLGTVRPDSSKELLMLADLILGPSRALAALREEYPSASVGGLVLSREDCRLVWRTLVVIRDPPKPPVELHPSVDNVTGKVTLPENER